MSAIVEKPDKEKRRREILDAAFLEFSTKGYAGASMEAIARRARASKETLYAWFENKETLAQHAVRVTPRRDGQSGRRRGRKGSDRPPRCCRSSPRTRFVSCWLWRRSPTRWDLASPAIKPRGMLGQTIGEERKKFVDYILRCRAQGYIAFDDDPFEIVSLFVAMAQGEWSLRLGTGMLDKLTDKMIEDHAQRVTRIFLKGLAPEKKAVVDLDWGGEPRRAARVGFRRCADVVTCRRCQPSPSR